MTAVKFALFPNSKKRPKSLVDKFYYPKLGAGMLWEKLESLINKNYSNYATIKKSIFVSKVKKENNKFIVQCKNAEGEIEEFSSESLFFSNPLLDFIDIFDTSKPKEIIESRNKLRYRNHISVHLTIDKKLFDDNWIYIHSPDIDMARISDFTNFSSSMSTEGLYPLTLEYFCFEDEKIWTNQQEKIIDKGIKE